MKICKLFITHCYQCPFFGMDAFCEREFCGYNERVDLDDCTIIPEWCPLEDSY